MKKRIGIGCVMLLLYIGLNACSHDSDIYLEEYGENKTCTQMTEGETGLPNVTVTEAMSDNKESRLCYVYICGAVEQPGVYALVEGSRIFEVIAAAGGLTEEADDTFVNQAEIITDGMMVRVYTREEVCSLSEYDRGGADFNGQSQDNRIDINSATIAELMTLPGIGRTKAEAIVSYREEHGSFLRIEDLMKVPGIKEGTFLQMKDEIKVKD